MGGRTHRAFGRTTYAFSGASSPSGSSEVAALDALVSLAGPKAAQTVTRALGTRALGSAAAPFGLDVKSNAARGDAWHISRARGDSGHAGRRSGAVGDDLRARRQRKIIALAALSTGDFEEVTVRSVGLRGAARRGGRVGAIVLDAAVKPTFAKGPVEFSALPRSSEVAGAASGIGVTGVAAAK
jgi:hypothetical protein